VYYAHIIPGIWLIIAFAILAYAAFTKKEDAKKA